MGSFTFVDAAGVSWMVLPGLPAEHPEAGAGPLPGLTFHSARGTRVLPASAFPRPRAADLPLVPFGRGPRVSVAAPLDWGPLLVRATPWPPGAAGAPSSGAA